MTPGVAAQVDLDPPLEAPPLGAEASRTGGASSVTRAGLWWSTLERSHSVLDARAAPRAPLADRVAATLRRTAAVFSRSLWCHYVRNPTNLAARLAMYLAVSAIDGAVFFRVAKDGDVDATRRAFAGAASREFSGTYFNVGPFKKPSSSPRVDRRSHPDFARPQEDLEMT